MYLLGNRFHTDSLFQFKSEVTFKQLLAMVTYNATFAGVLMDMRKTAQQKFADLNCTVEDAANAGETVPVLLDYDDADKIEYENEFGLILFSAAPEFYRDAVDQLVEFSPWLNAEIVGEALGSILSICHLENILEISQKNPELNLNQVISSSAFAIYDNATIWLRDAVKDFTKGVDARHMPKISLTDYLHGVTLAMTAIAEYRPRAHDENTFSLFNTLYSLLNMVAINATGIQAVKTTQNLTYCNEPSYNMAYAHLNENEEVGNVTFPLAAINGLPMRYSNDNSSHQEIIVQIDTPDGVSPELVVKGMNYSFDTSCGCQHDCCGCVSNSVSATHLKGNFYLVYQSSSANW